MVKKALLIGLAVVVVAGLSLALYARSVLSSDNVRKTLEEQLTAQLGRPVRIGSAGASIFPRVSLQLRTVTVGDGSDARLDRVSVSTDCAASSAGASKTLRSWRPTAALPWTPRSRWPPHRARRHPHPPPPQR
jgi:hypothetical protein